jgi:hypothetical protein
MRPLISLVCAIFFLSIFTVSVSASMNPNARVADSNTTCSDADQTGPWEYLMIGGETIELKICFDNPSSEIEKYTLNYSLTGQSTETEDGHILSVPVISVEVGAGATEEVTVYVKAYDNNSNDDLTIEFWAKNNNSIPTESIMISLDISASSSSSGGMSSGLPFVSPITTVFLLIISSVIYRSKK